MDDRTQTFAFDEAKDIEKMKKEELLDILKKILDENQATVIYKNKPVKSDLHPTLKLIQLFRKLIKNSSLKYQLV